jgi:hypothetical protein
MHNILVFTCLEGNFLPLVRSILHGLFVEERDQVSIVFALVKYLINFANKSVLFPKETFLHAFDLLVWNWLAAFKDLGEIL